MKLNLVSSAIIGKTEADPLMQLPQFRKATYGMALGSAAIDKVIGSAGVKEIFEKHPEKFGLTCGSSFGELEVTKDFLKTLADSKVARPMLFQNSLHNSTTGFLAIRYHLTGPVITISHGSFAPEHAIEAASMLIGQKSCAFCLAVITETFLKELIDEKRGQPTAIAMLFTTDENLKKYSLSAKGVITNLTVKTLPAKGSYEKLVSLSLNNIAQLEKTFSSSSPKSRIDKSDFGYSEISWERP